MIKAAIEKILEMSKPNITELHGASYTDKKLHVVAKPHPECLTFHSLLGLTDVIKREVICYCGAPLIVRVTNECDVDVFGTTHHEDGVRDFWYSCKADVPRQYFNSYMPYEEMIINLRSKFVRDENLDELVALLGNIVEENATAVSDDGVTQTAVVKQGVALKANKIIKPIVTLTPFRTYLEVDQPSSEFLLRLKQGGGAALYEADGGAWKIEARHNIAEFLREQLEGLIDVLVVE
ncbi:MAG: hypothetical protein IJ045_01500 [Ruminiclostridium sp.]|nr:hypothetical protein [Ruminiclostridium sp.]